VLAAERIAAALERLAELEAFAQSEPMYAPMGLAIVDKNSPEGQRAQLLERMSQAGIARPPAQPGKPT
jgi:hypothetical protein